jgi:hypothetical protein
LDKKMKDLVEKIMKKLNEKNENWEQEEEFEK